MALVPTTNRGTSGPTTGSGPPVFASGSVGDYYLDTTNRILYQKRTVSASTVTIGSAAVPGSSASGLADGALWAEKYTLAGSPAGATFTAIRAKFSGSGTTATYRCVLYADSAGVPGARLDWGLASVLAADAGVTKTVTLTGGYPAANGDYWLGFQSQGATPAPWLFSTTGRVDRFLSGLTYGTAPPNPFGAGTGGTTWQLSIEADAASAAGPAWVNVGTWIA